VTSAFKLEGSTPSPTRSTRKPWAAAIIGPARTCVAQAQLCCQQRLEAPQPPVRWWSLTMIAWGQPTACVTDPEAVMFVRTSPARHWQAWWPAYACVLKGGHASASFRKLLGHLSRTQWVMARLGPRGAPFPPPCNLRSPPRCVPCRHPVAS
jgi:hypothetical protein